MKLFSGVETIIVFPEQILVGSIVQFVNVIEYPPLLEIRNVYELFKIHELRRFSDPETNIRALFDD